MKNKKCDHISFWTMYKIINFRRVFYQKKGVNFICSKCNKKCNLKIHGRKRGNKMSMKSVWGYVLWLFFPVFLIALVGVNQMNYITAIILVTLYHFIAMYIMINHSKLLKIKLK